MKLTVLTLKSIPTVEMKLPLKNAPSLNRISTHVFPTPLSPISITCNKKNIYWLCPINKTRKIIRCNGFCSVSSRHWLVKSQQWKYQNNVWNLFKVNNRLIKQKVADATFFCENPQKRLSSSLKLTSNVFLLREELQNIFFDVVLRTWLCENGKYRRHEKKVGYFWYHNEFICCDWGAT